MRLRSITILALSILLAVSVPAAAATRVALVIGNGAYASSPLANPPNDAKLVSRSLTAVGFDVVTVIDADQSTMKRAIKSFGDRLEKDGKETVGLFYYAGHGAQTAGVNYLIPVGAAIHSEKDLEQEAVNANWILSQMEFAGNRMNLIILDACRNNPFKRSFRSGVEGLARMDAPRGSIVAYATAPGSVAADSGGSGDGLDSPYSKALAQELLKPGVPVEQMFKRVRQQVLAATGDQQTPWEASSLTGDFYFKDGKAAPGPEAEKVTGMRLVFKIDSPSRSLASSRMDGILTVLRRRMEALGAKDATVSQIGDDRIAVQTPKPVANPRIEQILAKPARLSLRFVHPMEDGGKAPPGTTVLPAASDRPDELDAGSAGQRSYVVMKEEVIGGDSLIDARAGTDTFGAHIDVALNDAGAKRLRRATQDRIGQALAIVVDDTVISAPVVRDAIGERFQISGRFTEASAEQLALLLRSGSLPVPLLLQEKTIGAPESPAGAVSTVTNVLRSLMGR